MEKFRFALNMALISDWNQLHGYLQNEAWTDDELLELSQISSNLNEMVEAKRAERFYDNAEEFAGHVG